MKKKIAIYFMEKLTIFGSDYCSHFWRNWIFIGIFYLRTQKYDV